MTSVLDVLPAATLAVRWPTADRVGVAFYPGERADVRRCCRRLFGRVLRPWECAGLAGAPDGARVDVGTLDGGLYLESRDPVANCYRAVQRVSLVGGRPVLVIDALHILPRQMRRKGLGLRMLGRQLTYARQLGVRRIETTAGRHGDENGYYTWPGPTPRRIYLIDSNLR